MTPRQANQWVRTRVTQETKAWCHRAARLLNWNVTGVESAAISYCGAVMTPAEFAAMVKAALNEPKPTDEGGKD
jgi:hypothetical protein